MKQKPMVVIATKTPDAVTTYGLRVYRTDSGTYATNADFASHFSPFTGEERTAKGKKFVNPVESSADCFGVQCSSCSTILAMIQADAEQQGPTIHCVACGTALQYSTDTAMGDAEEEEEEGAAKAGAATGDTASTGTGGVKVSRKAAVKASKRAVRRARAGKSAEIRVADLARIVGDETPKGAAAAERAHWMDGSLSLSYNGSTLPAADAAVLAETDPEGMIAVTHAGHSAEHDDDMDDEVNRNRGTEDAGHGDDMEDEDLLDMVAEDAALVFRPVGDTRHGAFAGDVMVAYMDDEKQASHHVLTASFAAGLQKIVADKGTKAALKSAGFTLVGITPSTAIARQAKAARSEVAGDVERLVDERIARVRRCMDIAASGGVVGMFRKDGMTDMPSALAEELEARGITNAQEIVALVLPKVQAPYAEALMSTAIRLAEDPDTTLASITDQIKDMSPKDPESRPRMEQRLTRPVRASRVADTASGQTEGKSRGVDHKRVVGLFRDVA